MYANNLETRVAYISMIGVLGCMQGRHIGSQLMRKCIQVAQNNGMQFIRLEVLNANKKALIFITGQVFNSKINVLPTVYI